PRAYSPGSWPFSSVSERQFTRLRRAFQHFPLAQQREIDRLDWWTYLEQIGFSESDLLRRDLMDSTDFGESIRTVSAYAGATEYFDGNRTDEMDLKIPGGNDVLVDSLVKEIRSNGGRLLRRVLV